MFRHFLFLLLASWGVSPLAVGFAQVRGFSNTIGVQSALLCIGIAVPFQLFLNEVLIPTLHVKGTDLQSAGINWTVPVSVCIVQVIAVCLAFSFSFRVNLGCFNILTLAVFAAIGNLCSFISSLLFTKALFLGKIRHLDSMIMGAVPGLCTLGIYLMYDVFGLQQSRFGPEFIWMHLFLPSLIQLIFVYKMVGLSTRGGIGRIKHTVYNDIRRVVVFVVLLVLISFVSNHLRQVISSFGGHYSSLVLVVLNAILSLALLSSKVSFLKGEGRSDKFRFQASLPLLVISVVFYFVCRWYLLSLLILFLYIQWNTVELISRARKRLVANG